MDEDPAANLWLEGTIGNIIHEIRPSELIRSGVLARPYFKFFDIKEPDNLSKLSDWRDVYEKGIVNNVFRNQVIAHNAVKLNNMGHKTLIIVQEINHANNIFELLQKTDLISQIVTGKDEVRARTNALKSLSKGHIDAIICSNIFDEGIDVKDVSGIILAAGTKAAPALFQRTGRALRKKDDGGHAVIIDFIDRQHPMLLKQSEQRYSLVQSEEEFKII
jgi:superfamily II DNA or RNA helicase